MVCYADCYAVFAKDKKMIKKTCSQLKVRIFVFTKEGDANECLGINFYHYKGRPMRLLQLYLIIIMIDTIPGMTNANPRETASMSSVILTKYADRKPMDGTCSYHSVVGMMNFVSQSTHLEIACTMH